MLNKNAECEFSMELTRLMPRLSRYAFVLTRSEADAADLVQATLERALTKKHQWRVGSQLDRWVFTIQSSIWKNNLRAEKHRKGNGGQPAEDLADTNPKRDPERTFLLQQVLKQVMQLPLPQRSTILLVYVEGYSYQEAADILQCPLGTVMSRLARARIKLAAQFQAAPVEKTAHTTLGRIHK